MRNITNEEKVLKFLIEKNKSKINDNSTNDPDNKAAISQFDIEKIELSQPEIIHSLHLLETDGHLKPVNIMPRNEFNRFYEFELTSTGFHYFENKKEKQIEKRNEWIKFWIPVTISILALFISLIALRCSN